VCITGVFSTPACVCGGGLEVGFFCGGGRRKDRRRRNKSKWLWLTSEQMGFPLRPTGGGEHEERAEDLDSSQGVRDQLVAYHLATAITDFISDEIECAATTILNRHAAKQ